MVTPNVGQQAPPPYPLVDNGYTVLDIADVVMVDPIGTGFSRPAGDTDGTHFWGMDEDAASLTQFIRRFLSENQRWNSPRYILGESYGTTRSVLLARHLQNANIDLNGIVLVSAVIDFNTLQFPDGSHIGFITNVPSFAVAAEYHDMLPGGRPDDLETFMKEVEAWALTDYAQALLAGTAVDPEQRARVLRQMHEYTGLSMEYLDKADLRVSAPEFEKELLRDRRLTLARLDTRFTGPTGDLLDLTPDHDAQSSAISSAYTSLFNTYVRDELGYDGDREYWPSGMARPWNWERQGGAPRTVRRLGAQRRTRPRARDRTQPAPRGPAHQRNLRLRDAVLPHRLVAGATGAAGGAARQHHPGGLRRRTHDVRGGKPAPAVAGDAGGVHHTHGGRQPGSVAEPSA